MRVIVTRPRGAGGAAAGRLRELGHEVVVCPLLEIEPLGEEPIEVADYDWVVVTSANGADELARRRTGAMPRLAAVGPGTAQALRGHGLEPELVPAVSTQEGLLEELPRPAGRVLVAAAEGARALLADELGADVVALYRTRARPAEAPAGRPRGAGIGLRGACLRRARPADSRGLDRAPDDDRRRGGRARGRGRGHDARSRRARRRGTLRPVFITFLTDFGLADDFVGTCHGVIKSIAPEAQIIDITHGISPRQVLQGSLVLANTISYMPVGVHLAVVDPGVGTPRRPLALRDAEGRLYVGPDNGLLVPAAESCGGVVDAHELASPAYALASVSRTFHGRDLFAPAAAHLALGVPIEQLGPPVDPDSLVRLDVPEPEVAGDTIEATVLDVDRFGNVGLNLTREYLERAGVVPGTRVELESDGERFYALAARTSATRSAATSSCTRTPTARSPLRSTAATPPRPSTCARARRSRSTSTCPDLACGRASPKVGTDKGVRGAVAPARTPFLRRLDFRRLGEVAQLVEHTAENRGVAGSSPALATSPACPAAP